MYIIAIACLCCMSFYFKRQYILSMTSCSRLVKIVLFGTSIARNRFAKSHPVQHAHRLGRRKQFRSGTAMGVVIRSHTLILTLIISSCTGPNEVKYYGALCAVEMFASLIIHKLIVARFGCLGHHAAPA